MTDQEVLNLIRNEVSQLTTKVEAVHAELKPIAHLFRGNGKPSLEARIYHQEQILETQVANTRWAVRLALGSGLTALATVLWFLISK
tara:strand:- start:6147 stop:6407 length:261 start_codon:yes stop_codon:yes gene_type:complete